MPGNRWAVCRGLPPGILGKPIHSSGRGAAKFLSTGPLQTCKTWQPSLPLKRKELNVFWDSPLSLRREKKSKSWTSFQPPLPVSFQLRTIASFKFHLSFETICGNSDHWHFYFYLSDWKGLSPIQTVLLKRLELPPRASGRMVTSEREGEPGAWGGTELVQVPACLRLSWRVPAYSQSLHHSFLPDLQKPLIYTIWTFFLP